MDRNSRNWGQNPLRGMAAALRAVRRQPRDQPVRRTPGGDPNGLVSLLQNPDFLPGELREDGAVRNAGDDVYDDLPPLEHAGPSTSHTARTTDRPRSPANAARTGASSDSEDDLPALVPPSPSSSPRVSSRDVRSPSPRPTTSHAPALSASGGEAAPEDVAGPSLPAPVSPTIPREPRTRPRRSRAAASSRNTAAREETDAGAESDSSMPTLRTVSDSSSDGEEDSYIGSDSEWDDTDEYYSSDEFDDTHSVGPPPLPSSNPPREPEPRPPLLFDIIPNFGPSMDGNYEELFQSMREMLERASTLPGAGELRGTDDADPARAETILAGLEKVPKELARRYEQLRTAEGETGDGCAICRDDLHNDSPEEAVDTVFAALPFHPEANTIVAFSCAGKHLFHDDCIAQWLARKTTCPTCRFDIDPHSLTLKRNREGPNAGMDGAGRRTRVWRPPQVESLSDWLDAEEQALAKGIPRARPQPVMPIPGPPPAGSHHHPDFPLPDFPEITGHAALAAYAPALGDLLDSHIEAEATERARIEGIRRHQDLVVEEARAAQAALPPRPRFTPPVAVPLRGPLPPGFTLDALRSRPRPHPHPETFADEPEDGDLRVSPHVAAHLARSAAAHQVSIAMPPPEAGDAALLEMLERFRAHAHDMLRADPPPPPAQDAAFPAVPAPFEDVAGALAAVQVQAATGETQPEAETETDAFDAARVPSPIQADPNQALSAEAPLSLEEEYMSALLGAGLVGPEPDDTPFHAGSGDDWLDEID